MSVAGEGIRSKMLNTYYRVRDGYFIAFPAPHELQIRTSHGAESLVRIAMAEGERWAESFFSALDGMRTLGELIDVVPAEHVESVLKIVAALRREHLLESESPFRPQDEAHDWLRRLMGTRYPVRDWYEQVLQDASILVLGAGVLGSRVAGALVQMGTGTVTVADALPLSAQDLQTAPLFLGAAVGESRSEALARQLKQLGHGTVVEGVQPPPWEDATAWQQLMEGRSLVIVAEDSYRPRLLRHVNALALEMGVRWSMVLVDGWDVFVGPTFLPQQTGCLTCWEQQQRRALRLPDVQDHYVDFLAREEHTAAFLGSPQFADVAAGLLTSDIWNLLGILTQRVEDQSSLTLGRQLHMQMRSFDAKLIQLVKEPRCATCTAERIGREHR